MTDLVKTVLGGGWRLIVGWILPTFLAAELVTALVLPHTRDIDAFNDFMDLPSGTRQAALLAIAAVAGLVLAATSAPLYRILEGYLLWPSKAAERRRNKHRARRDDLTAKRDEAMAAGNGVRAGLLQERVARYPVKDSQFAPTTLGNAIRRFETYAGDRYQLDSQLLWHHLTAVAPDRAMESVNHARTNTDFFVAMLYGGVITAASGALAVPFTAGIVTLPAIPTGLLIAAVSYRLAVMSTDEWAAAVQAMVDHSREAVAAAFGMKIPASLADERLMWRAVNTLVRRPYEYSLGRNVPEIIGQHRRSDPPAAEDGARADPGAVDRGTDGRGG